MVDMAVLQPVLQPMIDRLERAMRDHLTTELNRVRTDARNERLKAVSAKNPSPPAPSGSNL